MIFSESSFCDLQKRWDNNTQHHNKVMDRRRFLTGVGVTGTVGIAGCFNDGTDGTNDSTDGATVRVRAGGFEHRTDG